MQMFLKPFKKLAGRVLLGLKPIAVRARGFKPNKTLLLFFYIVHKMLFNQKWYIIGCCIYGIEAISIFKHRKCEVVGR
jgi:hypothetical protein